MPAQRGLRAPLAHVLLGCLDATGTSTEDSTCPVRRPSSGRALRHVGGLANAPQVPRDAGRIGDEREQLHPSAAARAGQNVEPKGPFKKLRPRTIAASARSLGHVHRGYWSNRRLRRQTRRGLVEREERRASAAFELLEGTCVELLHQLGDSGCAFRNLFAIFILYVRHRRFLDPVQDAPHRSMQSLLAIRPNPTVPGTRVKPKS